MQKNLVIVESPAKAKTIEKFLGKNFKVLSSYGHIRDLKRRDFSIDTENFQPVYEIPEEKNKLVSELKSEAKKADMVWLASDEDREGEAISWHLYEVLGLKPENTRRIVFHEITKPAILAAIDNPRTIDRNLVNAQQARRVLDRIVGFKLSPVLWRKVKPSLSAGRVQSVTVRLIVEREREINAFVSEASYRVCALFRINKDTQLKAEVAKRFKTKEEAMQFLESCKGSAFKIDDLTTKPQKRTPAPPFTTSTLQQEAARKLGFSVSQTMMVAQRLYEAGFITYMRTDSMNLSNLCLDACKETITKLMGAEYAKTRHFHTSSKGAQEAHEAIRPTDMMQESIDGTSQEKRLYNLIWKRTIACQMADAEIEKTTVAIGAANVAESFIATGEVVKFGGFLKVYSESVDNENNAADDRNNKMLPPLNIGQDLESEEITAIERFSQHPPRYTEASLVHKLEELGIGRPSTYAPTISTIQQRDYVVKGDKEGEERKYTLLTLTDDIVESTLVEMAGAEKGKLLPTDIGLVVNDFLTQSFPEIMDYNFTANIEKEFDEVADGEKDWVKLMKDFYKDFEPKVVETMASKSEHKVGERQLGIDPKSGRPVFVKIGRFGPVVQIGQASDVEKPLFAQMQKGQSTETITLEEALELFKLPREVGEFEGSKIVINTGRFGPYVLHNKVYVSLPKDYDPMKVTQKEAVELIEAKRIAEAAKHIKSFDEEPDLEVINGRYGPYIAYKGNNYRLPKADHERAAELTLEECMELIKSQDEKPKTTTTRKRRTTTTRKK